MSLVQKGYRHSETFAVLKATRERIQGNPTSSQMLQGLDLLINKALTPILFNTNWFDTFFPKVLAWQTNNPRRKVIMDKSFDLTQATLGILLTRSPQEKLAIIKKAKFDRHILVEGISQFLKHASEYVAIVDCEAPVPSFYADDPLAYYRLEKLRLESAFGSVPGTSLRSTIQQAHYWLDAAIDYRSQIIEKYTRMVLMEARKAYSFFNYEVELDDIVQVFRVAAQRAVDKCDSGQGVLASYILNWTRTGRSSIQRQRREPTVQFNDYEDYTEDVAEESDALPTDTVEHLRAIARLADPLGAARTYLGLEEYLTLNERLALRKGTAS